MIRLAVTNRKPGRSGATSNVEQRPENPFMNLNSRREPASSESGDTFPPQAVAERAYSIWEERGRPEGQDLEHWFEAEQRLRRRQGSESGASLSDAEREADLRLDGLVQRPRGD
jgi:hypothetical protein